MTTQPNGTLLDRVRELYADPELHTDHPGAGRAPEHRLWRVVSHRGVVGVGATEDLALLNAINDSGARTSGTSVELQREPRSGAVGGERWEVRSAGRPTRWLRLQT